MTDAAPPEPLTLSEVKLNSKVDTNDEDTLFAGLIVAAREYVEGATGLVISPRTVTETAPQLGRWIDLVSWPISSISAIHYPVAGVMTPLPAENWQVSYKRRPVRVLPTVSRWGVGTPLCDQPTLPVEIDVVAGYADPSAVPAAIKQAMHLLVAHFYTNRTASEVGLRAAAIAIPFGVDALLAPYRLRIV